MDDSDSEAIRKLQQENERINEQLRQMTVALARSVEAQSLQNVIQNGIQGIADMLEPLRSLRPERTMLTDEEAWILRSIRATLKRPDFSDLENGYKEASPPTGQTPKGMAS